MQQRAARAPVAVREGVDGLELRVEYGGLRNGRDVLAHAECHEILQARPYAACMRGHERGPVRAVGGTAYPDLLVAQALRLSCPLHEHVMDGADRLYVDLAALPKRFSHRGNVARDGQRVGRRLAAELGECDVAHARGEPFDLRARRRLAAEQERGKGVAACLLRGIEAREGDLYLGEALR